MCRNAHTYAWPVDFVPFELHAGGLRNIFRTLEEDFQQMRNKVISQHPAARTRMGFAAADIQESEKQVSLRLDLPGLSKEDIKVALHTYLAYASSLLQLIGSQMLDGVRSSRSIQFHDVYVPSNKQRTYTAYSELQTST